MAAFSDRTAAPVRTSPASIPLLVLALATQAASLSHAQPGIWRAERTMEIVVPAAAGGSIHGTARVTLDFIARHS